MTRSIMAYIKITRRVSDSKRDGLSRLGLCSVHIEREIRELQRGDFVFSGSFAQSNVKNITVEFIT